MDTGHSVAQGCARWAQDQAQRTLLTHGRAHGCEPLELSRQARSDAHVGALGLRDHEDGCAEPVRTHRALMFCSICPVNPVLK